MKIEIYGTSGQKRFTNTKFKIYDCIFRLTEYDEGSERSHNSNISLASKENLHVQHTYLTTFDSTEMNSPSGYSKPCNLFKAYSADNVELYVATTSERYICKARH